MDFPKDDQNSLCDTCKMLCRGHWCLRPIKHTPFAPQWVRVESQNEDIVVESQHHVLGKLQISVKKGCRLCAIIFGTLSERSINLLSADERPLEQKTSRTTYQLKPRGSDVILSLTFEYGPFTAFRELLLTPMGGELCCP
jgi:hypothetical protein